MVQHSPESPKASAGELIMGAAVGLAVTAAFAYFGFADSKLDLAGDLPKEPTESEEKSAKDEAQRMYLEIFQSQPAVAKYAIQYAGVKLPCDDICGPGYSATRNFLDSDNNVTILGRQKGSGILAGASLFGLESNLSFNFGDQTCLAGSGYDTSSSEIRVNGLFVDGGGDISAVATFSSAPEGVADYVVFPASGVGEELHFNESSEGYLVPANSTTERTLIANGCDTDVDLFDPKLVE